MIAIAHEALEQDEHDYADLRHRVRMQLEGGRTNLRFVGGADLEDVVRESLNQKLRIAIGVILERCDRESELHVEEIPKPLEIRGATAALAEGQVIGKVRGFFVVGRQVLRCTHFVACFAVALGQCRASAVGDTLSNVRQASRIHTHTR